MTVARPSPGIDDLTPNEYVDGWKILSRKVKRYRPEVFALVGVTLYRAISPLIDSSPKRSRGSLPVLGIQPHFVHGARIFVLPNPSGRNANFSYAEMLEAFGALRQLLTPNS